jgi:hypothetical protein
VEGREPPSKRTGVEIRVVRVTDRTLELASPFVEPDVTRELALLRLLVGFSIFLLAIPPDKAQPLLENDRVIFMETIGRETASAVSSLFLMGQPCRR